MSKRRNNKNYSVVMSHLQYLPTVKQSLTR